MEKSRFSKKYRNTICPNCETPLDTSDRYCSYCGQLNSSKKLSFNDFFYEFFGSIISYDSKLRKTLSTLIFKPGKISLEYIKGKRASYSNPFRFYLSISIIFFILYVFSLKLTVEDQDMIALEVNEGNNFELIEDLDVPLLSEKELDTLSFTSQFKEKVKTYLIYHKKHPEHSVTKSLKTLKHENSFYNKWIYKRSLLIEDIVKSPKSFVLFAISKLPLIIFFFIPFFTLILWLTYGRSSYTYMEHLVFAFHSQTMLFFLMSFNVIIDVFIESTIISSIITIAYLAYLFKSLMIFYKQGFAKTLIKFVFLNILFIILASITTMIAFLASFALY